MMCLEYLWWMHHTFTLGALWIHVVLVPFLFYSPGTRSDIYFKWRISRDLTAHFSPSFINITRLDHFKSCSKGLGLDEYIGIATLPRLQPNTTGYERKESTRTSENACTASTGVTREMRRGLVNEGRGGADGM